MVYKKRDAYGIPLVELTLSYSFASILIFATVQFLFQVIKFIVRHSSINFVQLVIF